MSVFRVNSLEQALTTFARERQAGRQNPTFTVPLDRLAEFQEYANRSYTLEYSADGQKRIMRGVVLLFLPEPANEHTASD